LKRFFRLRTNAGFKHYELRTAVRPYKASYRYARTELRTVVVRTIAYRSLVWFGGLFFFNESLEPQPRARRGARLAEDAPARNAFWTGRAGPNPGTTCITICLCMCINPGLDTPTMCLSPCDLTSHDLTICSCFIMCFTVSVWTYHVFVSRYRYVCSCFLHDMFHDMFV
jgi:hypothetical protein